MGKIFVVGPNWDPISLPPDGGFYCVAKGLVRIKPGLPLNFAPNMLLCDQVNILNDFPSGSLQFLNLGKMEVTDQLLAAVGKLRSLRTLRLDETEINDDRMKYLSGLQSLQNLNLQGNTLKGSGLRYLSASKELLRIDLSYVTVDREIGQNLTRFPKLRAILLHHSDVKDSALADIAKIQNLEHLKISSNNDITDGGIKALLALKHLRYFEIDDTKVTTAGLLALKGLPIQTMIIDTRYNNKSSLDLLHKAFPLANIKFRSPERDIPIEVFDPLH